MPPDDSPGEPKRLKLRSTFGGPPARPASEGQPPSAPKETPPTPPRLKISLPGKSASAQSASPSGPLETVPRTALKAEPEPLTDPNNAPGPLPQTLEDNQPLTAPVRHKTSPVYYVLLVMALIGSLYVLFRDKWATEPSPEGPPRPLAASPNPPAPERPTPPSTEEKPATTGSTSAVPDHPAARFVAALQSSPPLYLDAPKGILLRGIVFPVGSLLQTDPEVRLTAIEEHPEGRTALLASEGETYRLPLR